MRKSVNFLIAASIVAALSLAACTNPEELHGNLPDPSKVAQIKPGVTDRAGVQQLLGSPSSIAAFDPNVWYYVSQKTRPVATHMPELLDQQVLAIDFDTKGVVRNVSHATMADREPITPDPNATPAPGREFTVMEQLIGNFGRFTGADTNKNPGGPTTPGGGM